MFAIVEHRCIESAKIRNKYPDRVPVSYTSTHRSRVVAAVRVEISAVCVCARSGDRGEGA